MLSHPGSKSWKIRWRGWKESESSRGSSSVVCSRNATRHKRGPAGLPGTSKIVAAAQKTQGGSQVRMRYWQLPTRSPESDRHQRRAPLPLRRPSSRLVIGCLHQSRFHALRRADLPSSGQAVIAPTCLARSWSRPRHRGLNPRRELIGTRLNPAGLPKDPRREQRWQQHSWLPILLAAGASSNRLDRMARCRDRALTYALPRPGILVPRLQV